MSEQFPGHSTDPSQYAGSVLLRQREYEVLKWAPDVTEIDLQQQPNGVVAANVDTITPLQIDGDTALLASAKLGPEKVVQIWGMLDEKGGLRRDMLLIEGEKKSGSELPSRPNRQRTTLLITPDSGAVNIGRHNETAVRRLELPLSVSRDHLSVELTAGGELRLADAGSTYGTHLIVSQTRPEGAPTPPFQEVAKDTHLATLFAPRLTTGERPDKAEQDAKYREQLRRLVRGEPEPNEPYHEKIARDKEDAKYIEQPTEKQQREASARIVRAKHADEKIEAIIQEHAPNHNQSDQSAMVEAVRTNADLRYELGSYLLLEKLPKLNREHPHTLPYRVAVNSEKSPNHAGYAHMGRISSREYAVLLALAMLDGTYKEPGYGDEIERNAEGRVELGQHRHTAEVLLDAYPENYQH